MKAVAVFPASRRLELIDHPEPRPAGPDQVTVRVLEVGVCGTDREIAAFDYGTPPGDSDYLVLGHESLGEIVETGTETGGLRVGDLAALMVRRPCPHAGCVACRSGRQDFCYTGDYTERGIRSAHGFMTGLVVDDSRYVVPVPARLRAVAVLTEPLTIAEKALRQIEEVQERLPWACHSARRTRTAVRARALVLGAGPVGLLGAMLLARAGYELVVYSRNPAGGLQAGIVELIGGRYISARDHDAAALPSVAGRFDVVYEATGASRLAFDLLRILGPNAVFVFTGVPGRRGPVEVDTSGIMRAMVLDNQVLFGTVNAGRDAFEAAIRDLDAFEALWPGALERLISGRYPLTRHAALLEERPAGIKHVLTLD